MSGKKVSVYLVQKDHLAAYISEYNEKKLQVHSGTHGVVDAVENLTLNSKGHFLGFEVSGGHGVRGGRFDLGVMAWNSETVKKHIVFANYTTKEFSLKKKQ